MVEIGIPVLKWEQGIPQFFWVPLDISQLASMGEFCPQMHPKHDIITSLVSDVVMLVTLHGGVLVFGQTFMAWRQFYHWVLIKNLKVLHNVTDVTMSLLGDDISLCAHCSFPPQKDPPLPALHKYLATLGEVYLLLILWQIERTVTSQVLPSTWPSSFLFKIPCVNEICIICCPLRKIYGIF